MDRRGVGYALAAYTLWGLLPIYWKVFEDIPAFQVLMHRMVWSLVFLAAVLTIRNQWGWLENAIKRGVLLNYTLASLLLATNWGIFIWAVNSDYIVETSLGYYITPLFNVIFGMLFFKETLRAAQWVAVGIALLGVGYLTANYGQLPWIGLSLAFTFGVYGVPKEKSTPRVFRRVNH